jgi:hypothetical protein
MSKDLFMLMRESEIQTSNFLPNKKEIQLVEIKKEQIGIKVYVQVQKH